MQRVNHVIIIFMGIACILYIRRLSQDMVS